MFRKIVSLAIIIISLSFAVLYFRMIYLGDSVHEKHFDSIVVTYMFMFAVGAIGLFGGCKDRQDE